MISFIFPCFVGWVTGAFRITESCIFVFKYKRDLVILTSTSLIFKENLPKQKQTIWFSCLLSYHSVALVSFFFFFVFAGDPVSMKMTGYHQLQQS